MTLAGTLRKWLTPGLGVKRWLVLMLAGITVIAWSIACGLIRVMGASPAPAVFGFGWFEIAAGAALGLVMVGVGLVKALRSILAPYRKHYQKPVIDVVYRHLQQQKGVRIVAIGGGTGLPSVLKGLKLFTSNLTAVVTVADDGGSSGRLRRDLGVLPPGDLRNNIAALADDEELMTQLFQYRFQNGDLGGHAFGNLFISALSGVTGSLETALIETERVLNIVGRVLPATLDDIRLRAIMRVGDAEPVTVDGESNIGAMDGQIETLSVVPADVKAFHGSIEAILNADIVIIGPGSLFTSILPNLLVTGIGDALRATNAYKIYICNIATQPGETTGFTVADHVLALERHIGRGVFQTVLANNHYPTLNAGANTRYVPPVPEYHEVLQRYHVHYADLVDNDRPWRHDPQKIVAAILSISDAERVSILPLKLAAVHAL